MRTGRLDRRITIHTVQYTIGDTGQRVESSANERIRWANVRYLGGTEKNESTSMFNERRVEFTIRFDDRVGPNDYITWEGRTYDITYIEEVTSIQRRRYQKIGARLKGLQDG